jgi:hypothetical protein
VLLYERARVKIKTKGYSTKKNVPRLTYTLHKTAIYFSRSILKLAISATEPEISQYIILMTPLDPSDLDDI